MTRTKLLIAALMGTVLALPASAAEIKAVASFSILGDIVSHVGGDRVEVTTIVGPNADTHVYEPKPADAQALSQSQVFFVNGLGFEGWLDRLVEATGFTGPVVVASTGVATHTMADDAHGHGEAEGEDHAHDATAPAEAGHDDHAHAEESGEITDPHAWQSLKNGLIYVQNITDGLCTADPDGCATYQANAKAYSAEISALDAQVVAAVDSVPQAQRKVITTHDAFGYFGEAYGVQFLAPEGISTDSEASAADVGKLIEQIRADGVKALFIENMSDGRLVEQIARETGVTIGGELYADALSEPSEGASTYLDMFRHNVDLLVPAMAGTPAQ
ncbi:metal ABC transporter substrate-binding protein [Devosia sp. FKR38]|uniref:metal ABC transporter substrate-binding protein n=1 Tax=Devosia sp. FKR38 TaxID=2562312 RepID=UPI0010BF6B7B|nr:metal ABC transporter substrate-binding protein [Devosia sp. FKR38]